MPGQEGLYHMVMRVTSFRNCANRDCNGHYQPSRYTSADVPSEVGKLQEQYNSDLLVCVSCGTVWLERRDLEYQTCYIVRPPGSIEWLKSPRIQGYKLKRPRKTISPRRLRRVF